jgi:hypothetical protein
MSKNKNNDVIDDDVTEEEDNVEDDVDHTEEDEEEESFLETTVRGIMDEYTEDLSAYVVNPSSPDEVTQNDSIKKFIKLKVRDKVLEAFDCKQKWEEDEELRKLDKAHKRAMNKDPDLDAMDAMKHVLRKNNAIDDMIERMLDEEMADEEDEEMED